VPEFIDPQQFVITRKRKKYRFAKFHNSPLCFELAQWQKRPVDYLEIGAGNGMFTVEQAALRPDMTFVALDVKGDRLQKGAYEAEQRGLTNIFFVRARADQITELFNEQSVKELWITFPDPFPKKGSAGRRLTAPYFLASYKKLIAPNGKLYLKHDNRTFFMWSLEQLVAAGWLLDELSFDLHASELADHYKLLTAYERRWLAEGLVTNFVSARPPRA
jgi:tRNA (guanine-N7-)-methyltransferase